MANELPMDLIQQVQKATREEAGLSDYDPTEILPPLPSISETVAAFDPSPPYLRCKNCKGRLLRGMQSLLCVYCGRPNDVAPDPISFRDTFAYRWLLESLHLDGSDTVGPTLVKGESNRGQNTAKDEILLCDLLNFKITWPAEEKREINESSNKPVGRSFLSLTGIDLDNYFYESRRVDASSTLISNHAVTAESKTVASHDNLSFFENIQPSESAVHSSEDKNNDAFSGWEADFQSANSGDQFGGSKSVDPNVDSAVVPGNHHENSKPSSTFRGSSGDLSSQMDSVFGSVKDSKDGKIKDDSTASPPIGEWTSDDIWNNVNPKVSLPPEQSDRTVGVKDTMPQENMNNADFSFQLDSFFGPMKDSKDGKPKDDSAASTSINDWSSDDMWNNLNSEASPQTEQPDATARVKDALPQDNMGNLSKTLDRFQVDQWQINTNVQKINTNVPPNNVTSGEDFSFDDWDDFASSTHVQDSSANAPTQSDKQFLAVSESTSEANLFSSDNNLEEMDFGTFSQADPIPSSSSKGSVSTEMNNIGLEVYKRVDAKSDTGEDAGQAATDGDVHAASHKSREDVEMLLSQMHDLSFMLENNLSVPSKSDGL